MRYKAPESFNSFPFEASFRISHPKDLGKGNLCFVLSWVKEPLGEELAVETGWRVFRGIVTPPSQQDRRGRWFATITPHGPLLRALETMVQAWKPLFPEVQFPETLQAAETSK